MGFIGVFSVMCSTAHNLFFPVFDCVRGCLLVVLGLCAVMHINCYFPLSAIAVEMFNLVMCSSAHNGWCNCCIPVTPEIEELRDIEVLPEVLRPGNQVLSMVKNSTGSRDLKIDNVRKIAVRRKQYVSEGSGVSI